MSHLSGAVLVLCLVACALSFEFGLQNGASRFGSHHLRSFAQGGSPPSGSPPSGTPPSGPPPSGPPPSGPPPGCESGSECSPPGPPPSGAGGPPGSSSS